MLFHQFVIKHHYFRAHFQEILSDIDIVEIFTTGYK